MDDNNVYLSLKTKVHQLTLLYLEKTTLTNFTPTEFAAEYSKIFAEIYETLKSK